MNILHSPEPIETYIESKGLSQKEFGDLIGASQAAVSQWISGARGLDIRTAERMQRRTKGEITVRALFPKLFAKAS